MLAACGSDTSSASATTTAASPLATAGYVVIPEETAGPYPGDGSNGKNILDQAGVVRRDIRASIGTATGVADGVPLTINLTVLDSSKNFAPLANAAVYVWHCDKNGNYSMYSQGVTNENYLRGVQTTDADGNVSFTSIFPAAYPGRWPHIHFEVYPSLADATSSGTTLATSQIALPEATCNLVYSTTGYTQSKTNMATTTLASDNVFGDDGGVHELATISGSVDAGIIAQLTVPV